jgi:hypothetical protein
MRQAIGNPIPVGRVFTVISCREWLWFARILCEWPERGQRFAKVIGPGLGAVDRRGGKRIIRPEKATPGPGQP